MKPVNRGRRRLAVVLCVFSGVVCGVLLGSALVLYGTPYNPKWWWVMGAILAAAWLLPAVLIVPIEWVIAGYREQDPA